jgi:hypothetical protein
MTSGGSLLRGARDLVAESLQALDEVSRDPLRVELVEVVGARLDGPRSYLSMW